MVSLFWPTLYVDIVCSVCTCIYIECLIDVLCTADWLGSFSSLLSRYEPGTTRRTLWGKVAEFNDRIPVGTLSNGKYATDPGQLSLAIPPWVGAMSTSGADM